MTQRAVRCLVGGLVVLMVVLLVGGFAFATAADTAATDSSVFGWAIAGVFAMVGALVALRHPRNAIGWICLGVAVSSGASQLAGGYTRYWIGGDGSRELGQATAMYTSVSWMPFILVPATYLLLLFPDGRLLSQRWRVVAWAAALGIALAVVTTVLTPGKVEDYPQVDNPYAIDSPLIEPMSGLAFLLLAVAILGSAASLIVRFRRSSGEQRQQIKWLALAGVGVAIALPVGTAMYEVWGEAPSNILMMSSVLGLPAATGVAILRYRLYDIDVVINRTIVYAVLTATLAGAYLAIVLVLQLGLRGVTKDSSLAVAASTLAVAALFRPARTRIQRAVDRRFFRQRYDAQRTLQSFSARLRDQIELAALDAELRSVVVETMQPSYVSLWLRGSRGTG